jgi:hypothetical protein
VVVMSVMTVGFMLLRVRPSRALVRRKALLKRLADSLAMICYVHLHKNCSTNCLESL